MKAFSNLGSLSLLALTTCLFGSSNVQAQNAPSQWPLHDNGLNDVVQWDHYSFKVNGKRLFVFSGELHYWRIPVPEVWEDILEKIKAAGFTAFAFYGHWGYHSANNSTLDFATGAHDINRLFEIAKRVGLYIIVRPGPYVNAEANAGGFPLWLTTGAYGELRDDDPRYTAAWEPYFSNYSAITSKHLVTNNGNTLVYQIENEYGEQWEGDPTKKMPNTSAGRYMAALELSARENGIDVPLIHNDPNMYTRAWSKDFAPNATGNVDVAGLDSYPSCWSCNLDECTGTNGEYVAYQVINYYDHFVETSPTQPSFFPEFQGGSYNPWGGPEGGCPTDIGADFANIFYRNLISQRVSAISLYMMYGGTNWGALAAPVTATSYDYSSPISENRIIGSKFYETKNLAMFTRVAHDLTVTERLGNSTLYTTNAAVMASELRNPDTKAAFYVTIHSYSPSSTIESFHLHVSTSIGNLTIPQRGGSIVLNGHQSKILVTDFAIGKNTLTYSTAEVLTYALIDGAPVVVMWTGTGESVEFHIKVEADHLTTPNPTKPDTLPVLYVDDYDFHNSFHLFRGYFNGSATAVKLSVQGGLAFGWSAWLNGKFLGSYLGNTTLSTGNLTLAFANGTVHANGTNVLVVAQDNTGHDLRAGAVLPRGILGASLQGSAKFHSWKIAGTAGGDKIQLDPIRGPLNEGGLAAERLGWHLAGFDDSTWNSSSPSTGFRGAGIQFYRHVFALDIPKGLDVSLAFVLGATGSKKVRVQLFVNGYQYGKFNPLVGNEVRFPVPPGVLNYAGDNTIGLSVWAQSEEGAAITVELEKEYVVASSWSSRFDSEYLRPGWTAERLAYA